MSVVEAQGDSESQILFSFLERLVAQVCLQIFFSRTLEKLGRTLEPCNVIRSMDDEHNVFLMSERLTLSLKSAATCCCISPAGSS